MFREVISKIKGLYFISENLKLKTAMGKRFLLDTAMLFDTDKLNAEFDLMDNVLEALQQDKTNISHINQKLVHLRNISGSIANMRANLVLDDVELFEIKLFGTVAQSIREILKQLPQNIVTVPNFEELNSLLDPQKSGIPTFYIYDEYSEALKIARETLKKAKAEKSEQTEQLFIKAQELEQQVREQLCDKIRYFANDLALALNNLAHLDVLIAKTRQAQKLGFCRPKIVEDNTTYDAMFHPMIKHQLEQQNQKYQAIDIDLKPSVCFITGANMAGKTVVLRTLALCQYMCQFGFFVPAQQAQVVLVEKVLVSVGDEQSEENGLSSFAAEMVAVSNMVEQAYQNKKILVLIDELARTTNPVEGLAIVNAVADIFYQQNIRSVITTHYSGIGSQFRKLRVKGLDKDLSNKLITEKNINSYMDYRLIEDKSGEIPHEALRIAALLNINKEIITKAQYQLNKGN